jgi:hypothetical protein
MKIPHIKGEEEEFQSIPIIEVSSSPTHIVGYVLYSMHGHRGSQGGGDPMFWGLPEFRGSTPEKKYFWQFFGTRFSPMVFYFQLRN